MKKGLTLLLPTTVLILLLIAVAQKSSSTVIVRYPVNSDSHSELHKLAGYSLAVVSDLHLRDSDEAFIEWHSLIASINLANPDYVFLLGDYSQGDLSGVKLEKFIDRFSRSLDEFNSPVFLVLGNYETWTDRKVWQRRLLSQGRHVLENNVTLFSDTGKPLCVRGIGDHFTGHDKYIDFPVECAQLPSVTITHDPGGVFRWNQKGFFLAGHTHCGQVNAPILGVIWAPTDAPRNAQCGFYQDGEKVLFTSSGVGTSILPMRFLAQSQVEILRFESQ